MGYWTRAGTLSVANGSTSVAGVTTAWLSTVRAGDLLFAGGNAPVEVGSVDTNTGITLVQPWPYITVTNGAYAIAQGLLWADVTRLANAVSAALASATQILSGIGAPSNSLGTDGSAYFQSDAPYLYFKASGVWDSPIDLTGPTGAAGPAYAATSTTSRTIAASGSMSFTVAAGGPWAAGNRVRIAYQATPSNYMEGVVSSYSGTTLTVTMDNSGGSGTFALWNIFLAGDRGSTGPTGASYSATSATSLTIGTGTQTLTTQSGLAYAVGTRARVASSAVPSNYMEGVVTAYSGTSMTINVDLVSGAGTIALWNISLAGAQGTQGVQGIQGVQGVQGVAGASFSATSTTSNTIGIGNKTFTTQSGLAYVVGSRARAADSANPAANWIEGVVTTYSSTSITIAVDTTAGSGTITSWNLSLAGAQGAQGSTGSTGPTGPTYNSTASNTLTPTVGSQSLTVVSGLPYVAGQRIRVASAANPTTNWLSGIVTSYSGTTLTVTTDLIGSAPFSASDFNISLTGEKGDQGPSGGFGALSTTKGNVPIADGSQFGVQTVGVDGAVDVCDSTQPYGRNWATVASLLAKGNWPSTNVAAAPTLNLSSVTTPVAIITGNTNISAITMLANQHLWVKFAGTPTLTYNGTSLILPGLANRSIIANTWAELIADASGNVTMIQILDLSGGVRTRLTAALSLYVDAATGSNSNNGLTSGTAFHDVNYALGFIQKNYDIAGQQINVNVLSGTQSSIDWKGGFVGGGSIFILGPASGTATFDGGSLTGVSIQCNAGTPIYLQQNITIQSTSLNGLVSQINSHVVVNGGVNFGGVTTSGGSQIYCSRGGYVEVNGSNKISGSAGYFIQSSHHGTVRCDTGTMQFQGNVSYTGSTVFSEGGGDVTFTGGFTFDTNSYTVTGTRYSARTGAIIQWASGSETSIPGSAAGTLDDLSVYWVATAGRGASSAALAGQYAFPATQNPSTDANTLDDYEEGTFTPTIVGLTTAGSGTYSVQDGWYTKIGRTVFWGANITWSAHTGTGNMALSGLPFTAAGSSRFYPCSVMASSETFSNQLGGMVPSGGANMTLYSMATGAAIALVAMDTAATLYVTGHYVV